jgi:hypothetical protein
MIRGILTDHREFETAEEMLTSLDGAREYLAGLSEVGLLAESALSAEHAVR